MTETAKPEKADDAAGSVPGEAFELRYPATILFGWGTLGQLPAVLGEAAACSDAPPVLLVSGRRYVTREHAPALRRLCGTVCAHYVGVPPDPPLETVDELADLARSNGAGAVVAVGGGSVIDAAKAAAIVAGTSGSVRPFFEGTRAVERPGLPLIAVPTTAGTGAEITKNAVLTDRQSAVKKSLRSPLMVPHAAIVDPELTLTMPPDLTAATGLDALTQALESYISLRANGVTRPLAAEAVRLLLTHLPAAFADGRDVAARTAVAKGSLLSAMAFSQSGLGATHGLAHPLGVALHLAHGLTCGILLPHVLAWNAPVCQEQLALLARAAGMQSAERLVSAVCELWHELGVPGTLAEHGLCSDHFDSIVANCRSGSMRANPRPMTDDDVRALLVRLSGRGSDVVQ